MFEQCNLDTGRRELRRGAAAVPLEPKVFDLLVYLIANRERVVSKHDLLASVWGGRIVSESALTTRLNAVRSAIGDSGEEQRLIKTLPRKGIRFVGEVREEKAESSLATESWRPSFGIPDRPSIAVLPFTNMSGDSDQEYFADGMAEEIITAVSHCAGLFVIARNSSVTYKGKTVDVRQVGRELGVRYVLEGSVRRVGNRVRFTGQLIDTASGAHIWADRFDGELSYIFELQDRFTESVVAAIELQLQLAEIARLKHKPVVHLDAYDLLLRAQQLEYEYTRESLATAIGHVQRALAIDPTYAPATALGAYCYTQLHVQGWADNVAAEGLEGVRLANLAVEFGKSDANVLWMSVCAVWNLAMDRMRAHELVSHSLAINSNSAMALTMLGWIESCSGNPQRSLELLERAERLSPRDPRGWLIAAAMANAHLMDGRFTKAVMWEKKSLMYNSRMFRRMIFTASFFLALCSPDTVSATSALAMIQKTGFCAGSNGKDTIKAGNAALVPCRKKRSDFPLYVTSSYIERGQFFSCASVDGGSTGFAQEFESTQNAADNAAIQACEQVVGWKKDQKGLLRQRCKVTYRLPGCSP